MKGYATLVLINRRDTIADVYRYRSWSRSRGLDYRNYYNGTLLGYHSQIFNL